MKRETGTDERKGWKILSGRVQVRSGLLQDGTTAGASHIKHKKKEKKKHHFQFEVVHAANAESLFMEGGVKPKW